ncbi:MAG TPA: hypothetical protein VF618_18935 [Thermoanaerobaculia bacterium]
MRRSPIAVVCFVVLCAAAVLPLPLNACNYECKDGCDATFQNCHAFCYEYVNTPSPGYMASCTEKQICYKYRDGSVYCSAPTCDGTMCYQV